MSVPSDTGPRRTRRRPCRAAQGPGGQSAALPVDLGRCPTAASACGSARSSSARASSPRSPRSPPRSSTSACDRRPDAARRTPPTGRTRGSPPAACRSSRPRPALRLACANVRMLRRRGGRRTRELPSAPSGRRPAARWYARAGRRSARRRSTPVPAATGVVGTERAARGPARTRSPAGPGSSPTCGCPGSCSAGSCGRRRPAPGCASVDESGRRRRRPRRPRRLVPRRGRRPDEAAVDAAAETLRRAGDLGRGRHPARRATTWPASSGARRVESHDGARRRHSVRRPAHPRGRARYSRPFLAHASIAPSCGVARWDADGTPRGVERTARACSGSGTRSRRPLDLATRRPSCVRARRGRRLLRAQRRRRRRVRRGPAGPGGPGPAGAGAVEPPGRADLGTVRLGDGRRASRPRLDDAGRHRVLDATTSGARATRARPGYAGVPGLLAAAHLARPLPTYPAAADPPDAAGGGGTAQRRARSTTCGNRRVRGHRLLDDADPHVGAAGARRATSTSSRSSPSSTSSAARGRRRPAGVPAAAPVRRAGPRRARDGRRGRRLGIGRRPRAPAAASGCRPLQGHAAPTARWSPRSRRRPTIRVRRLTIAVDVGRVVNPDGVRNQIEGGAIQATSWTLQGAGALRPAPDHQRRLGELPDPARSARCPRSTVDLLDRPGAAASVGAGEAAQGPTAAAIANAAGRRRRRARPRPAADRRGRVRPRSDTE